MSVILGTIILFLKSKAFIIANSISIVLIFIIVNTHPRQRRWVGLPASQTKATLHLHRLTTLSFFCILIHTPCIRFFMTFPTQCSSIIYIPKFFTTNRFFNRSYVIIVKYFRKWINMVGIKDIFFTFFCFLLHNVGK